MNDKDKEAFDEWFIKTYRYDYKDLVIPESIKPQKEAWQAACEYKQSELAYHIYKIELEKSLLGQEVERLQNYVIAGNKEGIDELEAVNAKLRECVEFYASPYSWCCKDESPHAYRILPNDRSPTSKAEQTGGKRARQCLKELDEK